MDHETHLRHQSVHPDVPHIRDRDPAEPPALLLVLLSSLDPEANMCSYTSSEEQ